MTEPLSSHLERIGSLIEANRTSALTLNDVALLQEAAQRIETLRAMVDQLSDGVSVAEPRFSGLSFAEIRDRARKARLQAQEASVAVQEATAPWALP